MLNKTAIAGLLAFILLFFSTQLAAQCNLADKSPVRVTSITVTDVTCPQNGTITVNGVSGGGQEHMYEIFSGPVIRGIQSQNVFSALLPGNYRVRVTGCNGVFYESGLITVGNHYLEPEAHELRFLNDQSFKCNTTNTGKVIVSIDLSLPNNVNSDTQLYRLPLTYQVSANGDPSTGFASSPIIPFSETWFITTGSGPSATLSVRKIDTITGLNAGTTYYVKVTDACGVFKTVPITMPVLTNPSYTFEFRVKEPYILPPFTSDYPVVKGNCVQWGELTILSGGSPVTAIPSTNTFFPVTAVLKRQDNGQVIRTRVFQQGTLYKSSFLYSNASTNNLIFDSVPRIPVTLEITDQCGTTTVLNADAPSPKVPFKIQAYSNCGAAPFFYINTFNAAPSLPVRLKIYDNSNTLLVDKLLTNLNYQHVYMQSAAAPVLCCNQQSFVPSFGIYRLVYEDQCGISDSIVYDFHSGGLAPAPAFSFTAYQPVCSSADGIVRHKVDVVQTVTSPVGLMQVISGPAGVNYPVNLKTQVLGTAVLGSNVTSAYKKYFDSLVAGTYQVRVLYGCNQVYTTSFTVGTALAVSLAGTLSFTLQSNVCNAAGTNVNGGAMITSTDVNYIASDPPWIRITNAPLEFLKSISVSRDGSEPALPFNLGMMNAGNFNNTGIDTNTVSVYPLYGFSNIANGYFRYPAGDYTFQLFGKCSGTILDTKSFSVTDGGYSKPNLGASSGYLCDGGEYKVVASPIGGRRNFLYQIKIASDPDEAHYSPLQSDSIFLLPASTIPGTVYTLRAVDACNNSFVGQVVVNSFTGTLMISSSGDCVGAPARILTGFIPGAIYTWTKPDGSVIVTNSNELTINTVTVADIGVYQVSVNALDGCITKTASAIFGSRCYTVLPVSFTAFTVKKLNENMVELQWETSSEINIHHYDIESSLDGIIWNKIGYQLAAGAPGGKSYTYIDKLQGNAAAAVIYYRLKAADAGGQVNYTPLRKVYFSSVFNVIKVYPTPFISSVSIDFMSESREKAVVSLFDMSGREVSKSVMPVAKGINHYQYTPVFKIDAGNYILTLTQGTNRYSKKVTKVN